MNAAHRETAGGVLAGDGELRGALRFRESMSRHTTLRLGGVADCYYEAEDLDDLALFLRRLPAEEPVTWVGRGSNLLVRDGGIRGVVISTRRALARLHPPAGARVYIEAGVPCSRIARFCAGHGLAGAEFLAGIPGTLGGALAMNAGAHGVEIWELTPEVRLFDRRGGTARALRRDFRIGYRSVGLPPDRWFAGAVLELRPGNREACVSRIREILAERAASQPLGQPNCGSVFRNPAGGYYAARLIEQCGLKGLRVGGARVSRKHANFIVNEDGATAADIETLIRHIQRLVQRRCGILLTPELRIVGEPPTAPGRAANGHANGGE
ncbi:MAG: UDP-N-acetylmuramate dehydrogenase [Gammaproteobacteria bacterium]|nr:UDP-N-acetylmuramate dehydrogenase [Gammaproteobacteria bacterium]MDD9863990.1 UDP-N-acetylmuramate dehydrogenase [Gammaproteobacteria bacterium]